MAGTFGWHRGGGVNTSRGSGSEGVKKRVCIDLPSVIIDKRAKN